MKRRKTTSPTSIPIRRLLRVLTTHYPEAVTALHFTTPLQLLVATILSAQCTDKRVNMVTPALFERFPDAASFANADVKEIEQYIASTGFFRNKAKNIQKTCQIIVEIYHGEVPASLEALVTLPGVGRKTANVVLGDGFGTPGITVDTHVGRLSRRMGLTTETNPEKVERDLMAIVPHKDWTNFSHRMILHGRAVCSARKPRCSECPFTDDCPRVGVTPPSENAG